MTHKPVLCRAIITRRSQLAILHLPVLLDGNSAQLNILIRVRVDMAVAANNIIADGVGPQPRSILAHSRDTDLVLENVEMSFALLRDGSGFHGRRPQFGCTRRRVPPAQQRAEERDAGEGDGQARLEGGPHDWHQDRVCYVGHVYVEDGVESDCADDRDTVGKAG